MVDISVIKYLICYCEMRKFLMTFSPTFLNQTGCSVLKEISLNGLLNDKT